MRYLEPRLVGVTLVTLTALLPSCAEPRVPAPSATGVKPVEILRLIETAGIPGLTLAEIRDGQIARVETYGVESVETGQPVTEETLFEAASLTKPVFAYLVLRLVERGELSLDRPLHELLQYERFAGVERARALTPRIVLSHRTGLPNWGGEVLEFGFEPGSAFGYSGEGYVYLQRVVEAQTGLPLEELIAREVFEPLGMTHSQMTWSEEDPPRLAIGHDESGTPRLRNPYGAEAAGSLLTTARDYARFALAMLTADGLEPSSVAAAWTPAIRMSGDERGFARPEEVAGKVGWGLGWGIQEVDDERLVWHWGDNEVFHAFVALRPVDRSGIVYFANSSNGLAIARPLVGSVVGDIRPTFDWLGYGQIDDPGWTERREGSLAEGAGDYRTAIEHFESALAVTPEDEQTARRVEWLRELIAIGESPVTIPPERLEAWAGSYGPRILTFDGAELTYQRQGRELYRLLPVSIDTFALEGMVDFRIRVVSDARGRPTMLQGLYLNGDVDESARDPE